jgi:hypothetical protein
MRLSWRGIQCPSDALLFTPVGQSLGRELLDWAAGYIPLSAVHIIATNVPVVIDHRSAIQTPARDA